MFKDRLTEAASAVRMHMVHNLAEMRSVPVVDAMAYATRGGKFLRAFMVLESARLHGVDRERAVYPATAIEAIHAYSLIHDDLPAMDDDDLRRGQPTVHRAWDEATAILAGDALQAFGFEMVAHPDCHANAEVRADLAFSLAQAAGARGMVLGQALDIAAESADAPLSFDQISDLQAGKTGALMSWAAEAGPRMARADIAPMSAYAGALGLAFQITDDILDIEGDEASVGKALRKDASAGKATFVSLLGLDEAKRRATRLVTAACDALSVYGARAEPLRAAAHFVVDRTT
ncbi:MAG: polyprenyl synthetase family protein [Paracoccaceae bacterium]